MQAEQVNNGKCYRKCKNGDVLFGNNHDNFERVILGNRVLLMYRSGFISFTLHVLYFYSSNHKFTEDVMTGLHH